MMEVIITCEHGGNDIPPRFETLFQDYQHLVNSHCGWDIGALKLAKTLSAHFTHDLFFSTVSRLLVDLNRSLHNPRLFSVVTKSLPKEDKQFILDKYYFPYRHAVENRIQELVTNNVVLHISVHSFTPVFHSTVRKCSLGLLYDPKRQNEQNFCSQLKQKMMEKNREFILRFNYPYMGTADGFVTYLRKKFTTGNYIGIEIEMNQTYFLTEKKSYLPLKNLLMESLKDILNSKNNKFGNN